MDERPLGGVELLVTIGKVGRRRSRLRRGQPCRSGVRGLGATRTGLRRGQPCRSGVRGLGATRKGGAPTLCFPDTFRVFDTCKSTHKKQRGAQLKFGPRADAVRRDQGKPTGIVRFENGHFVIVNDMPKKPEWDQEKLAAIADEIRRDGVDPGHYLDTIYKVQERRYTAWPPHIQQAFAAARTLKVGKPSFRIEIKGGA